MTEELYFLIRAALLKPLICQSIDLPLIFLQFPTHCAVCKDEQPVPIQSSTWFYFWSFSSVMYSKLTSSPVTVLSFFLFCFTLTLMSVLKLTVILLSVFKFIWFGLPLSYNVSIFLFRKHIFLVLGAGVTHHKHSSTPYLHRICFKFPGGCLNRGSNLILYVRWEIK